AAGALAGAPGALRLRRGRRPPAFLGQRRLGHRSTVVDLLGRPVAVSDAWGATTTLAYDLAGRVVSTSGPGGNLAYDYDPASTRLAAIEMGARTYLPALGRFLQVDPVPEGSCNDYDYACGDPVNGFDLDGTVCWSCLGKTAVDFGKDALDNKLIRAIGTGPIVAAVCTTGIGCVIAVGAVVGRGWQQRTTTSMTRRGRLLAILSLGVFRVQLVESQPPHGVLAGGTLRLHRSDDYWAVRQTKCSRCCDQHLAFYHVLLKRPRF
ncbi:MAG TPA: RHS repeat-associated core domain-containing protein, partial [Chloroflexota bacterium]|nr:RHS repeat-associated core domain-containing protein [Chloroflexota bacterium]